MLEVQIYKKLAEFDLDVSFQVDDYILGLMGASGSGSKADQFQGLCLRGQIRTHHKRACLWHGSREPAWKRSMLPEDKRY